MFVFYKNLLCRLRSSCLRHEVQSLGDYKLICNAEYELVITSPSATNCATTFLLTGICIIYSIRVVFIPILRNQHFKISLCNPVLITDEDGPFRSRSNYSRLSRHAAIYFAKFHFVALRFSTLYREKGLYVAFSH